MALAWAAHELVSPLMGVGAALERALDTGSGKEARSLVERSAKEIRRLMGTVGPLLRWSNSPGELDRQSVDLADLASAAAEAAETDLEVTAERIAVVSTGPVLVDADPVQLCVAVVNLLRNALVYSGENPVTVCVFEDEGEGVLTVVDGGPGVGDEDREHLFDPFVRGADDMVRGTRGRGLGLFIARRIVEAHGGSIGAESWQAGSVFRIEVPLAAPVQMTLVSEEDVEP
jgi:signal transduction histidine kinase